MCKKSVFLWVILLALAVFATACSSGGTPPSNGGNASSDASTASTASSDESAASSDAPGGGARSTWLTEEKIEFEIFIQPQTIVTSMEDNRATDLLEELTNVHIIWNIVPQEEAATKLALVMSSASDLPDIFMNSGMNRPQADAYGSQGMLIPLQDYINGVSVNYKNIVTAHPNVYKQMESFDGNVYFLPRYYESVHTRHTQRMWMNKQWLENLGLSMPETTDQFYDVLKAFKEQDANGNGNPNDEIPLISNKQGTGWSGSWSIYLMSSFVYNPSEDPRLYVEDGIVKASYVQDGWKEGLKFYRRLHAEGLLDPEFLVIMPEQIRALSSDPAGNRIGCFPGGIATENVDAASPEIFEYTTMPPLTGPTGLKQAPTDAFQPVPLFSISTACKNPEIAFRWADFMAQDMVAMLEAGDYSMMNFWYGPEDDPKGWSKAVEGETGFTGKPAYIKWNFAWGDLLNTHWYEVWPMNMRREFKEMMTSTPMEGVYDQERELYEATVNNYEPYEVDMTLPVVSLDPDESAEFANIQTVLKTYYDESSAKFIIGEWDIDGQWDAYKAELNNIGLERALELNQIAYDRTYK
jgi:putative aldouronate transport system substrate-binding protein